MTEPTAKSKAEAATVVSASRLVPSTLSSDYAATLSNCLPPTPPPPKCRGLTLGSDTSLPSPSSHPPPSPKVSIRKLSAMKLSNLASMGIHSTFDTQAIYKRVKEVLAEEQRLNDLEGEGELMKLSRMGKRMRSMSVEIVNTRESTLSSIPLPTIIPAKTRRFSASSGRDSSTSSYATSSHCSAVSPTVARRAVPAVTTHRMKSQEVMSLQKLVRMRPASYETQALRHTVFDATKAPLPATFCEQQEQLRKTVEEGEEGDLKIEREERGENSARRRSISMDEKALTVFFSGALSNSDKFAASPVTKETRKRDCGTPQRLADSRSPLYHVGRELLDQLLQVVQARRCTIIFMDKTSNELFYFATEHAYFKFPAATGIAGWVYKNGTVLNISDAHEDKRFNEELDEQSGFGTESILCAPIFGSGGVAAVLQCANKVESAAEKRGWVERGLGFNGRDEQLVVEAATKLSGIVEGMMGVIDGVFK